MALDLARSILFPTKIQLRDLNKSMSCKRVRKYSARVKEALSTTVRVCAWRCAKNLMEGICNKRFYVCIIFYAQRLMKCVYLTRIHNQKSITRINYVLNERRWISTLINIECNRIIQFIPYFPFHRWQSSTPTLRHLIWLICLGLQGSLHKNW